MNRYYQKNKYVSFLDAVEYDENLWVANTCFNGLYRLKRDEERVKLENVTLFATDNMEIVGTALYFDEVFHEKKIYFMPYNTFNVAVFDLETETISYICLPQAADFYGYIVAGYAFYDEYLYLFSQCAKCSAVRIHMETFEIEKLQIWDELVKNYCNASEKYMIASAIQMGDSVWIGIRKTNRIIRYSLKNERIEEELECGKEIAAKVLGNKNLQELYNISSSENIIECINLKRQNRKSYLDLSKYIEAGNRILHILSDEKQYVIIPFRGKYVIIVDRKNGCIIKHQSFPEEFENFSGNNRFFYTGRLTEQFIELFPYYTNGIIRIERQSGETNFYSTAIETQNSVDDLVLEYQYQGSFEHVICSEQVFSLDGFLDILGRNESIEEKHYLVKNIGERIAGCILNNCFMGREEG